MDLSHFAYKFNSETLLENLDSQDETTEEELSDLDIYKIVIEIDTAIDDADEEPVSELQEVITTKEAEYYIKLF